MEHSQPHDKFITILYSLKLFNIFTRDELRALLEENRLIKWKKFAHGSQVFAEGAFDQHFYIVMQGDIFIMKENGGNNMHVGTIHRGEAFGELVVCAPERPHRASAFVGPTQDAVVCELDATLVENAPQLVQAKFCKKFFDLVLARCTAAEAVRAAYSELLKFAREQGAEARNDFFQYCMQTAPTAESRMGLMRRFTDFLVAVRLAPEISLPYLRTAMQNAVETLEEQLTSA